jgi:hypothetical protein
MMRPGPNQRLVLSALMKLEEMHGRDAFLVRAVLDQIWDKHFIPTCDSDHGDEHRLDLVRRAAGGEKDAIQALKMAHESELRLAARHRVTKRRTSTRPWARAVEQINPSRCFRLLAEAGLIERLGDGPSRKVKLTDEGRRTAERHSLTDEVPIQGTEPVC